ncbi:hypothetical protein EK21DRAFT_109361 [Setomelanomma holmii]|uniref:Uncharacterized protein n=1 Tax=Setomelanomma holmii TaxID=210430 RepID=A0A9P4LQ58_9PLEO|nr:hypothetical protein EK21DRAFT_109361 [Setomelanomma holmii]
MLLHMVFNNHYYREIYAAAMVEAGYDTDAKYTMKSAMYQAAFAAITRDFKLAFGKGWPFARLVLRNQFPKMFDPELPRPGLLAELDAELAMGEWMLEFEEYPLEYEGPDTLTVLGAKDHVDQEASTDGDDGGIAIDTETHIESDSEAD